MGRITSTWEASERQKAGATSSKPGGFCREGESFVSNGLRKDTIYDYITSFSTGSIGENEGLRLSQSRGIPTEQSELKAHCLGILIFRKHLSSTHRADHLHRLHCRARNLQGGGPRQAPTKRGQREQPGQATAQEAAGSDDWASLPRASPRSPLVRRRCSARTPPGQWTSKSAQEARPRPKTHLCVAGSPVVHSGVSK